MTPDREIQAVVRSILANFDRLGSLRQVLMWFHEEELRMPALQVHDGECTVRWELPNYQQLMRVLKNPVYAGAFVYGRTKTQLDVAEGRSRKRSGRRVAMEHWQVLIKDHHEAYISWEKYMENQQILHSNRDGISRLRDTIA